LFPGQFYTGISPYRKARAKVDSRLFVVLFMTQVAQNTPIFIASHKAEQLRDLLSEALDAQIAIGIAKTMAEVLANYANEPVVLGRPDFAAELLKTCPPVEWVQSTWAGIDPLLAIDNQDYQLTGVKGVFGPQMTEYVMAYLLAHEIKIQQRMHSQEKQQWDETPSGTVKDKVLGVMGTGSIGRYVAEVAMQFAMKPIGFNSSGKLTAPFAQVYGRDSLEEFLSQCDYVFAVLPDTPATSNLLNEQAFAVMKDTAFLISAGRGNVVDERALCGALIDKQLAGAVLDVFREEPLPVDSPLWDAPNLLISGHVAAASNAPDIAQLFVENYRLFTSGQPLRHLVDFHKGY